MAETTTTKKQRMGIWIVTIVMIVATVTMFAFMIWATQNSKADPSDAASEKVEEEYKKQQEEYEKQMAEERKKLEPLKSYKDKVTKFDKDSVKELKVETLKEGKGATISENDTLKLNYTGWTPDGKIFDSTKKKNEDASPASLSLSNLITGWKEGLTGKKVGGVYLLSIPSDKAYGETGTSDGSIGKNTPIKFIVEAISVEKDSSKSTSTNKK